MVSDARPHHSNSARRRLNKSRADSLSAESNADRLPTVTPAPLSPSLAHSSLPSSPTSMWEAWDLPQCPTSSKAKLSNLSSPHNSTSSTKRRFPTMKSSSKHRTEAAALLRGALVPHPLSPPRHTTGENRSAPRPAAAFRRLIRASWTTASTGWTLTRGCSAAIEMLLAAEGEARERDCE